MQFFTLIAQALFTYFLLWWVAFPSLLAVNLPDFEIALPWRYDGQWGRKRIAGPFRHHVVKKAVLASLIAFVAWIVVFPLVKSDLISFAKLAETMN